MLSRTPFLIWLDWDEGDAVAKSNALADLVIDIEICELNNDDLSALVKKTFVLITTVGPYAQFGEHVSVPSHVFSHALGHRKSYRETKFPLGLQSVCREWHALSRRHRGGPLGREDDQKV